MHLARVLRRSLLTLAVVAVVAGCLTPNESTGPTDLDRDKDNNGLPDDAERNMTNTSDGNTTMPGLDVPGAPDEQDPYAG